MDFIGQSRVSLNCCEDQETAYVGIDSACTLPAIFCLRHNPHMDTQTSIVHQMIQLKTFKRSVYEKKFYMSERIDKILQDYDTFMDKLIKQLQQLQVRKKFELNLLWLRELATDQYQYQCMKKIYKMDFEGIRCTDIARVYNKINKGQKTTINQDDTQQKKIIYMLPIQQLNCYQGMIDVLKKLNNNETANRFIRDKVAEVQGLIESGQVLKKALPKSIVFQGSLKQVLLQTPHFNSANISYNTVTMHKNQEMQQQLASQYPTTGYFSIFSRYPVSQNTKYHIKVHTKFGNIMIGVCRQSMLAKLFRKNNYDQKQQYQFTTFSQLQLLQMHNLHYEELSLVYNCANGCIYKDGTFTSEFSTADVKGKQQFKLILMILDEEFILSMDKGKLIARCKLPQRKSKQDGLFLHILGRTESDVVTVQREIKAIVMNQKGQNIQKLQY